MRTPLLERMERDFCRKCPVRKECDAKTLTNGCPSQEAIRKKYVKKYQ